MKKVDAEGGGGEVRKPGAGRSSHPIKITFEFWFPSRDLFAGGNGVIGGRELGQYCTYVGESMAGQYCTSISTSGEICVMKFLYLVYNRVE